MSINNLLRWNDRKHKTDERMRADYPLTVKEYEGSGFPSRVLQYLLMTKNGR
ncbi:MAG: hypothetical protein GXY37_05330 [Chloroflexi bacterium]|nr:hypothetical protein [Chloroflexota bacterium]